ncbi:O-antigen ligase family protein [Candidatus Poribacteria bacterium]|nr:O-antigen ligase family protein [Candidatus Poribacteria bacterium]
MNSARRFVEFAREDSLKRRLLHIDAVLALIVAGVFFYWIVMMRFLPDFGVQLMGAVACGAIVLLGGPGLTFPLYFCTWFGSAIPFPGLPLSLNKLLATAFALSWIVSLSRRHLRLPNTPAVYFLVAFTIYAVMTGILFKVPGAPLGFQQLVYLFVGLAVASTWRVREDFMRLAGLMVALTCLIHSVGLFEFLVGRDLFPEFSDFVARKEEQLRINGIAKNAIYFAFTAAWALPWALFLHIESKSARVRFFSLAGLVYLISLCLMTYNRQTPFIIGIMLAVGLVLVSYRYRAALAIVMILGAAAVSPLVVARIAERISDIGSEGRPDASFAIRYDKYLAAREMIPGHLWFGIGLNNFKDIWWNYRVPGEMYIIHYERLFKHYIDMGYLEILTETGLVGLVMFTLLMVSTWIAWWRLYRRARRLRDTFYRNALAAAAMGLAQLQASLVIQDTFFVPQTYLLFGLFFALMMMTRRALNEARESPAA